MHAGEHAGIHGVGLGAKLGKQGPPGNPGGRIGHWADTDGNFGGVTNSIVGR